MLIEIKNIQKSFGRKNVLKNVSFSASEGKCVGIIGANGCGKSTLFSILSGVQYAKSGEFVVGGVDLLKDKKIRSKTIGYIPQGAPLIEELNAYDNLLLWCSKDKLKQMLDSDDSLIKKFGVDKFLRVAVRKMSGGMKKRLSIVCSVVHEPKIIIMDEPTAALDIICKETIKNYINDCKTEGKTVIISTHEEHELEICDEIYVLKNGVLEPFEYNGNIAELAERIK